MDESKLSCSPTRAKRSLTAHYSSHLLHEPSAEVKLQGITVASCNPGQSERDEPLEEIVTVSAKIPSMHVIPDVMSCTCCQVTFLDREEQINHYKSDWHRYNLHHKLKGLMPVTEDKFEEIAGDVSSISGSDDDEEEEKEQKLKAPGESSGALQWDFEQENTSSFSVLNERRFHKIFFVNDAGEMISIYRCLLHHKKNPIVEPESLQQAAAKLPKQTKWIIVMLSAGHFAGAVFQGKEVLEHKTFHRYTVRAKRGTTQSSKDKQGGTIKSAGASLRRYNEAALSQEIQELMTSWLDHFKSCHLIFVRIPSNNRAMFYGGKNPILKKEDQRIRIIPFATRRPTFGEVKRVQQMLASVECYGNSDEIRDIIPMSPPRFYSEETDQLEIREARLPKPRKQDSKSTGRNGSSSGHSKRSSSRQRQENYSCENSTLEPLGVCSSGITDISHSDDETDVQLVEHIQSLDLTHLKQFECTTRKKNGKKKKDCLKEKEPEANLSQLDEQKMKWRNKLFTSCKMGNVDSLLAVIADIRNSVDSQINTHEQKLELNASSLSTPESIAHNSSVIDSSHTDTIQSEYVEKVNKTLESSGSDGEPFKSHDATADILNLPVGDNKLTFLHLAAREGHAQVVTALLSSGADPATKDGSGKLAYNLAGTEVRNAFRRFMAAYPDKYDYGKSQIPSPLTPEMENEKKAKLAERRKQKKKATQEKNKEKKSAEAIINAENEEKKRFLSLSDREKRALAAERRLLQQHDNKGTDKPVLSRCFQCGSDMTGKTPFEYSDFKFCSTPCLREHRAKVKSTS